MRDPRGMKQIVQIGVTAGIVAGLLFKDSGKYIFDENPSTTGFYMTDFVGPCFFIAVDVYVCMVFVKLLQIHTQLPVYIREVKDGLYTPSAYYLAISLITMV